MSNISLIAAMADNRVIGGDNKLLWHLPEDLRHFRSLTTAKPVVMGRKTYDSIGRPLPNRRNIVITRNPGWAAENVETATSLEQAFALAASDQKEIMVIGGATVYEAALLFATTVYLTHIHKVYTGDAVFPVLPSDQWQVTDRKPGAQSAEAGMSYEFLTYKRI